MNNPKCAILKGQLDSYLSAINCGIDLVQKGIASRDYATFTSATVLCSYSRFLSKTFDDLLDVNIVILMEERDVDGGPKKGETLRYPFNNEALEAIDKDDLKLIGQNLENFLAAMRDLSDRSKYFA